MDRGYIHIYTGNGKGKTTAAIGVAVRTLLQGGSVYVGQFIKGMKYSETRLEEHFPLFETRQYGLECFIRNEPDEADRVRAEAGYEDALARVASGQYNLVILDEIFIALFYDLLRVEQVEALMAAKHDRTELILTGRYCPPDLYGRADLVTDMVEIKHYYQQGVLSRSGVDC